MGYNSFLSWSGHRYARGHAPDVLVLQEKILYGVEERMICEKCGWENNEFEWSCNWCMETLPDNIKNHQAILKANPNLDIIEVMMRSYPR